MITLGTDQHCFTLNITGYQFQEAEEWWDLNWLNVGFTFPLKDTRGKVYAPCLTTSELLELRDWLAHYSATTLFFVEPELRFRFARANDKLWLLVRIWLNCEERVTVQLETTPEHIAEAVAELNVLIQLYPERAV